MKLLTFKTRTAWLEFKKGTLGSSEAASVMNASPWCKRDLLWARKTGRAPYQKQSPQMLRGLRLEPEARDEYIRMTGVEVLPAYALHDFYDFVFASFDGLNEEAMKLVEIKCPNPDGADHAMALKGKIPDHYIWQLVHDLLVSGYESIDYFSFDGKKGVIVPFKRNQAFEQALLREELKLWNEICLDQEPPEEPKKEDFQKQVAKIFALRRSK